jgi:hypothetical protein
MHTTPQKWLFQHPSEILVHRGGGGILNGMARRSPAFRLQNWALFNEILGVQMLENRSAGVQNSFQVHIKMHSITGPFLRIFLWGGGHFLKRDLSVR